jgi:hypothetical protein
VPDGEDHVGHGTHITVTVMRIAKWAEIYVATVVDAQGVVNIQSVAKVSDTPTANTAEPALTMDHFRL